MEDSFFQNDELLIPNVDESTIDNENASKISEKLNILRPNLFFGGAFYIHKGDYQNAFNLYDISNKIVNEDIHLNIDNLFLLARPLIRYFHLFHQYNYLKFPNLFLY